MKNTVTIALVSLCLLTGFAAGAAEPPSPRVALNIEPQPVRTALKELSDQAGVQVLLRVDNISVDGLMSAKVSGELTVQAALERLLANTGLTYEFVNDHAVRVTSIRPAAAPTDKTGEVRPQPVAMRVAQAQENSAPPRAETEEETEKEKSEMVVTGTNIRGSGPVGQQVEVITREDIARAGVGNMSELRDLITQHFGGGGGNPMPFNLAQNSAATITSTNTTYTQSFNLRGLGPAATLTLLNGRRLAPSSGSGNAFGVRGIPLKAVERIEIVTDGGSAVYGSDAVGGVVNVITRSDFEGVEATARYGSVTQGDYAESTADILGGQSWGSGNAFVYLDYGHDGELAAGDRDYISKEFISPDTTLISGNDHRGAAASISQTVSSQFRVGADLLWAEDKTSYALDPQLLGTPGSINLTDRGAHLSLRADYDLSEDWTLKGRADRSKSETLSTSNNEDIAAPEGSYESISTTFEMTLAGPVARLPAGPVQMALGALQRKETFLHLDTYTPEAPELKRDITSAYGEFLVPLARTLKLNLAGRWDDYSTAGSRLTPKYGISWQATEGLGLRASYAKAFRAPALPQSRDFQTLLFLGTRWNARPPGDQDPRLNPGQSYAAVFLRTGNPDLVPESAKIFTTGLDFKPAAIPGLQVGITYFDIDYDNIIFSIFTNRINNPSYADFVQAYPSAATVQALIDQSEGITNIAPFPVDVDSVQVLLDGGAHNIANMHTSGLDINARYGFPVGPGRLGLSLKSSYIFKYNLQATSLSATTNNVDRVGDPLRLTLRTSASYAVHNWMFTGGVNYKGAYVDDFFSFDPPAPQPVDSFTSVDVGVQYNAPAGSPEWAKGLSVLFNVRNLTDKAPPYVQDFLGFNFDGANADVVGRFVSLEITKSWGHE